MFIAIVPAYNESKRIAHVVSKLTTHVDEVVVVDDCSSDNTATLAKNAGATVLRHQINRGQGAALETGHSYARDNNATYVLHFDGDGQFDVDDIGPALEVLKNKDVDIVLGSRFLGKSEGLPWTKKHIIWPIGRLFDRSIGAVALSDSHNGFRILTKQALDVIRITQDRMAHASEIPKLIKKHRLSFEEVPVSVRYYEYGQRATDGIQVIRDLLLGSFLKKK